MRRDTRDFMERSLVFIIWFLYYYTSSLCAGLEKRLMKNWESFRYFFVFLGGFSAGYKGTVGSEEGFVPKAFTSSR